MWRFIIILSNIFGINFSVFFIVLLMLYLFTLNQLLNLCTILHYSLFRILSLTCEKCDKTIHRHDDKASKHQSISENSIIRDEGAAAISNPERSNQQIIKIVGEKSRK